MSTLGGIKFSLPNISGNEFQKEKEIKELKNYMTKLTEQLRYTLNNLAPEDNFTEEANKAWGKFVTDDYVTSEISQSAEEILLKVSKDYVDNGTMKTVISQTSEQILLEVSKTYETAEEASEFKNSISQTVNGIRTTVSKKVGKDEIISAINQSAESVTISANKISLEGMTFANEIKIIDSETRGTCNIKPGHVEIGLKRSEDPANIIFDSEEGITAIGGATDADGGTGELPMVIGGRTRVVGGQISLLSSKAYGAHEYPQWRTLIGCGGIKIQKKEYATAQWTTTWSAGE